MKNSSIRILIIDDEMDICFALKELFEFQGWKAYSAGGVLEGLQLFKKIHPVLVLIDYHMPIINGVEGVKRLRKLSPVTPIIVFTIDESQEVADTFLRVGASDFVIKPIKAPDIVSRINLHLRLLKRDMESPQPDLDKGLSAATLELVVDSMRKTEDYVTVDDIAKDTGLANQTVYRYLQYLLQKRRTEVISTYGKIGRPKQLYRLVRGGRGGC